MASFVRWDGYTLLMKRLDTLTHLDYTPVLEDWTDVIIEDNRAGVLAGLDKDGNPMVPVKYRTGSGTKTRFTRRTNPLFGRTRGQRKGYGPLASGLHGNLTIAEYKKLTGPPLAPRREESRVIANLGQVPPRQDGDIWIAECKWGDVVDVHGRPFLLAHFNGSGRLPKRDLRGVRPIGRERCRKMLKEFIKVQLED